MSLSLELDWLNPVRWTGPVLNKELRVLSRRKRTYWIKGLFPVFLALLVLSGWISVGRGSSVSAAGLQGLSRLSRSVVSSMTWLQFILCQCMAVMMMTHAMHDEIRRRTLDVLMTTPIRSCQIVLGKLFGQLMMVWVVLALSFPVLAIIRVWGGVPWAFLVATYCVTVCATLCVGAFSLLTALWVKRSHHGILVVLSVLVLGYVIDMFGRRSGILSISSTLMLNPFSVFFGLNSAFYSVAGLSPQQHWMPHCLIMLGVGLLFVILCVATLRRRTLNTIRGVRKDGRFYTFVTRVFLGRRRRVRAIRAVKGAPVLWKELGCDPWTYLKGQLPWIILLSGALVMTIVLCPGWVFQMSISLVRYLVVLRIGMMAALCVVQEKEARSWIVLLGTPVPDIWLLRHKAMAVLIKNASGWIPLLIGSTCYLLAQQEGVQSRLFVFAGLFSLVATLYMLIGMGLHFSVRMKTGAMAITALLIGWVVWQLVSRVVMMFVVMGMGALPVGGVPSFLVAYYVITPFLYVVVGAVMFKLAGRNLRKYVF